MPYEQLTEDEKKRLESMHEKSERAILLNSRLKRLDHAIQNFDREHINHAMQSAVSFLQESDIKSVAEVIRLKLDARYGFLMMEMAGLKENLLGSPESKTESECDN